MKLFYSPKTEVGKSVVFIEIMTLIWMAVAALIVVLRVVV